MRGLGLVGALALGVTVRLWQLRALGNIDILSSIDGYYYLDLARSGDWHSGLPAMLALAPGGMLEAGFWLPVVLGPLLAIPTYLWGRELTNRWGGFVAASIAVVAPIYLARTGAGRPDTDLLNVTFVMGLAWLCYRQRLVWATALWGAFLWWWDLAPLPATLCFLAPLTLCALRSGWQLELKPFYLWLFVASIAACLVVEHSAQLFYAVHSRPNHGYPPMNVAEMFRLGPWDWARATGGIPIALPALAGLCLMARRWRETAFLGVPVAISLLAIGSNRFLFFAAPLVGLGLAVALHEVERWDWAGARATGFVLVLMLIWVAPQPMVPRVPAQIQAFEWLQNTPEDSLIVADWGHGHLIRWYGQRQPYDDGKIHGRSKLYLESVPLASESPHDAAQWIKERLGGADRPTYVLVDQQKIRTGWWCYGTWNFDTQRCRKPGPWIRDTVAYRLLTQPSVPGFGLVFNNGFVRIWKVL